MAVTKMLFSRVEVGRMFLRKVSVYQTTGHHHFSEYRNFQSKNQLVNPFHLCSVFCV